MTKKNFKPPTLQHKNKWSPNFHDFLVQALKKDPRSRPTAHELLKVLTLLAITIVSYYCKCALLSHGPLLLSSSTTQHEFVNRVALSSVLMLSLIRVLEAPRKHKPSTSEETDEEEDSKPVRLQACSH